MSSSSNRRLASLLLGILSLTVAACYGRAPGETEACNGKDDNWDGLTDETFVDEKGQYTLVEHCGGCGIDCRAMFATAKSVACEVTDHGPTCRIAACPTKMHLVGDSLCLPTAPVQCLSCTAEADCTAADPDAVCVALSSGDNRCLKRCDTGATCDGGFVCSTIRDKNVCAPPSGQCGCTEETTGATFGCVVSSPQDDTQCLGTQTCDGDALSACVPRDAERCDGMDNDCDGIADEDFMVDGAYLVKEHCGDCHHPCSELAPNTVAECRSVAGTPTCVRECENNYVDLDGLSLNGCECFKVDSVWPPAALGGDMNCDGVEDSTAMYVFVSKTGNDANPGTLEAPVVTITRGIDLAEAEGRTIFVAQGRYDEIVTLKAGVSLFGGYRSDFGDYAIDLFEVVIERTSYPTGAPVLVARGITAKTELSGVTLMGSNGNLPGAGATTALIAESDEALFIHDVRVVSGMGMDGLDGRSSSEIFETMTGLGLTALDGLSGGAGQDGFNAATQRCVSLFGAGGEGGEKSCPLSGAAISGGGGGEASCPDTGCEEGVPCPNAGCDQYMVDGECQYKIMSEAAVPNPPAEPGMGDGGGAAGYLTYDAPTIRIGQAYCADDPALRRAGAGGGAGETGVNGDSGYGCTETVGTLDLDTGIWSSNPGGDGSSGEDGAGGGGGTQGNGYDVLSWTGIDESYFTDRIGGAGGGGGSGGCGAPGAEGGSGGGGAIGMLIILTEEGKGPEIKSVRVIPGLAGDGGQGGMGAAGGSPGAGGNGGEGNYWCARRGGRGGDGGKGGDGGGGGGGCGGSASGFHIVKSGQNGDTYLTALQENNTVDAMPAPGSGGKGGFSPGAPGASGQDGATEPFRLDTR